MFGSRIKTTIGIDIGASSIKLVELAGHYSNPKVVSWGLAPLAAGAFSESTIIDPHATADALADLIVRSGAERNPVAVSVSSSQAITKIIRMPAGISERDLEEEVSIEALNVIPYPLDEVNIDYEVIGPCVVNSAQNDVLLVACRRNIVDAYIELIEDAGLQLSCVDIDTYALARAYRSQTTNPEPSNETNVKSPMAIFDIASTLTHLVVLDKERVLYSRHQNFGAANLIKQMGREYGLSAVEAEQMLHSSQLPDDFKAVVQSPFENLLREELSRALQFFYSSSTFSNVDQIVLSGACCCLNGLAESLNTTMGTPVSIFDPIANAKINSGCDTVSDVTPSLAIAYGLSLRGLMNGPH